MNFDRWEVKVSAQIALNVGVYDFEKTAPQPVSVTVWAGCDFAKITAQNFVDYDLILSAIENLQTLPHKKLLEEWMLFLAQEIFKIPAVDFLKIQMQKTEIFEKRGNSAAASVSLFLSRKDCPKITL